MEVRMKRSAEQMGRRKFIKQGILVSSFIFVPRWRPASHRRDDPLDESHRTLLKIQQKYGGEFGDTRGGL
jgi:hypothetical protein